MDDNKILFVDLDGTLIKEDLSDIAFSHSLKNFPLKTLFYLLIFLFKGKPYLKYKISKDYTIPFEKLIVDPYFYIKKISRILNVKIDNVVKKTMKKNNVPRKFDFEKNQNLGFEFIKNKIRKKYLNELIGINQFYEKKYLGQFK